jgi:hypothetical protein
MFEVIVGAVCLGVLAVEIIEVRQKCEECGPGMRHEARTFQLEFSAREDKFAGTRYSQSFRPNSASLTTLRR